jgi:hypothetical protein
MRTEFASGAWVEHRPIGDLKVKDADAVSSALKMVMPMTSEGELDLSGGISLGGEMQVKTRNAVIARVVTAWSFTTDDGAPLPVPYFENHEIHEEASIGELPIDDGNELQALIAPYQAKLRARPDPKGATTSSSNGASRASQGRSRRA